MSSPSTAPGAPERAPEADVFAGVRTTHPALMAVVQVCAGVTGTAAAVAVIAPILWLLALAVAHGFGIVWSTDLDGAEAESVARDVLAHLPRAALLVIGAGTPFALVLLGLAPRVRRLVDAAGTEPVRADYVARLHPGRPTALHRRVRRLGMAAAGLAAWGSAWYASAPGRVLAVSQDYAGVGGLLAHTGAALLALGVIVVLAVCVAPFVVLGFHPVMARVGPRSGPVFEEASRLPVEAERRLTEDAELRWPAPTGPVLRLDAAVAVLGSPADFRAHLAGRGIEVPWTGGRTTVESLAGTLLAVSLLECLDRGLVTLDARGRRVRVTALRPPDSRPTGLAAVWLGRQRAGRVPGRDVDGTVKRTVQSFFPDGDEDPHWTVVVTALDELTERSVLTPDGMDRDALARSTAALPADRTVSATAERSGPLFGRLVRECHRALRAARTVDADDHPVWGTIALARTWRRRADRSLPPLSGGTADRGEGALSA